jgi:hypothetical protein
MAELLARTGRGAEAPPASMSPRRAGWLAAACPGLAQLLLGERRWARTFALGTIGPLAAAVAVYALSVQLLVWLHLGAVAAIGVSWLGLLLGFALWVAGLIFYFNGIEDAVRRARARRAGEVPRERPLWVTRVIEFAFTTDRYDL